MALDTLHQIKADIGASGHFSSVDDVDVALPNDEESHRKPVTAKVFYETIAADDEHGQIGIDEIVIRIDLKDARNAIEGASQMANGTNLQVDNAGGYGPSSTMLVCDDVTGVKVGDLFETETGEVIQVTAVGSGPPSITVTRAMQGTTAAGFTDNSALTDLLAGTYAGFEYYFKGDKDSTPGNYGYKAVGDYNAYLRITDLGQPEPITTGTDADDVGRYAFEASFETLRG